MLAVVTTLGSNCPNSPFSFRIPIATHCKVILLSKATLLSSASVILFTIVGFVCLNFCPCIILSTFLVPSLLISRS